MDEKSEKAFEAEHGPPPVPSQDAIVNLLERLTRIQENQPVPQQTVAQSVTVTPWNPTGKKDRVKLARPVFQNGHPLNDELLTDEEITLLNGLRHGRYHNRQWVVIEKDDGGSSSLAFFLPDKTEADRIAIARLAPRGLADILRMIHDEMNSVAVA